MVFGQPKWHLESAHFLDPATAKSQVASMMPAAAMLILGIDDIDPSQSGIIAASMHNSHCVRGFHRHARLRMLVEVCVSIETVELSSMSISCLH